MGSIPGCQQLAELAEHPSPHSLSGLAQQSPRLSFATKMVFPPPPRNQQKKKDKNKYPRTQGVRIRTQPVDTAASFLFHPNPPSFWQSARLAACSAGAGARTPRSSPLRSTTVRRCPGRAGRHTSSEPTTSKHETQVDDGR